MANEHTVTSVIENPTTVVLPRGAFYSGTPSIIDDQDNHLVLTLRVSKEFVRSNQPLLRALSEMSGPTLDALPKQG